MDKYLGDSMIWWILHSSPYGSSFSKCEPCGNPFCIILLCHLFRDYDLFLICKEHLFNMYDLLTEVTAQGISNILVEKWSMNIHQWIHIFIRFCISWITLNLLHLIELRWPLTHCMYWSCTFCHICGRALRNSHSEYWTHTKSLFENLSVHTCCASEK